MSRLAFSYLPGVVATAPREALSGLRRVLLCQ